VTVFKALQKLKQIPNRV